MADVEGWLEEAEHAEFMRAIDKLKLRARPLPRRRLADLVQGITSENGHSETDWAGSVGRERIE